MSGNRVVYDSDIGRLDRCARCKRRQENCICQPVRQQPRGDGIVRVSRERSGRKGKTVTMVRGLPGTAADLAQLATTLKRLCGSGGTVSGDDIEIQGDHRERVAARLTELGHKVKLAGG
jgi:translation initiation factor 1